ncbi:hypothetical protein SELMODRAFT_413578 [Selaginella moellendorffii]|uniref:Uncharacterized protein n=1 Tax=Selaginella moellendorffii TaxID=88036 RepID=D8RQQ4_SELML|nr:hypothetical protein SELMODRAFT_413578 [Selaginella moellendorffii]
MSGSGGMAGGGDALPVTAADHGAGGEAASDTLLGAAPGTAGGAISKILGAVPKKNIRRAAVSITVVLFLIPLPFLETGIQSSVFFGLSEINSISWYVFGREHNDRVVEVVNLLGFVTGVFYAAYAWKATWKPLFWPPVLGISHYCLVYLLRNLYDGKEFCFKIDVLGFIGCATTAASMLAPLAVRVATLPHSSARWSWVMSTMFAAGCAAILTCLMLV